MGCKGRAKHAVNSLPRLPTTSKTVEMVRSRRLLRARDARLHLRESELSRRFRDVFGTAHHKAFPRPIPHQHDVNK